MTMTLRAAALAAAALAFGAAAAQAQRPVRLLQRVAPARDGVSGKWLKAGSGVRSDDARPARLRLRASPEGDCNLRVEFTPRPGGGAVGVTMALGERAFTFFIHPAKGPAAGGTSGTALPADSEDAHAPADGGDEGAHRSAEGDCPGEGFSLAGGRSTGRNAAKQNPAARAADRMGAPYDPTSRTSGVNDAKERSTNGAPAGAQAGGRVRLVIKVRADGVEALVNGEPFARHRWADGETAAAAGCDVGRGAIGLVTWGSPTVFHRVELSAARPPRGAARARGGAARESGAAGHDRDAGDSPGKRAQRTARSNRAGTKAGAADDDKLPVGSLWSGSRTRVNQGDSLRCTMKVISRSGDLAIVQFTEGCSVKYQFALRLRRNGALAFDGYRELGMGSGRRTGGLAAGSTNGRGLALDYQWIYSDRRYKNRVEQGVIEVERVK